MINKKKMKLNRNKKNKWLYKKILFKQNNFLI